MDSFHLERLRIITENETDTTVLQLFCDGPCWTRQFISIVGGFLTCASLQKKHGDVW